MKGSGTLAGIAELYERWWHARGGSRVMKGGGTLAGDSRVMKGSGTLAGIAEL